MIPAALLEQIAMQLPTAERALLADLLLESLSPQPRGIHTSWAKEANHRLNAYRDGTLTAHAGPQAMADLKKVLPQNI
jgi:hypothetical protein